MMSEKIILIVEDNVNRKYKTFLNDLSGVGIKYRIEQNMEDALEFFINNKDQIDIVVLDMGFPLEDGNDGNFYAGAILMPKLIRHKDEIVIILNTPADCFSYKDFSTKNVIYVAKRKVCYSKHIENILKQNPSVLGVLDLLKKNNELVYPHSSSTDYVVRD